MRCIIILTHLSQPGNSLSEDLSLLAGDQLKVRVLNIHHIRFSENKLVYGANSLFPGEEIFFENIVLVVKRIFGSARRLGLEVCEKLEAEDVRVFNGCDLMRLAKSKIAQYNTYPFIPQSLCYNESTLKGYLSESKRREFIERVTKESLTLGYPLIFKLSEGSAADGVFLIRSLVELKNLLQQMMQNQDSSSEFSYGFLLQKFINSDPDNLISNYYRVNIVNGFAQSAVRFQLKWTENTERFLGFMMLKDFEGSDDRACDTAIFEGMLDQIIQSIPRNGDCVGVDVMIEGDKLKLLECNDSPAIHDITQIGEQYLEIPGYEKSAVDCLQFPNAIAKAIYTAAQLEILRKQANKFTRAAEITAGF